MNSAIINWLKENLQRFFTKSPKFFQIWTIISGALVLITWLPDIVNSLTGFITIPDLWNEKITLVVKIASAAVLFMSKLTTQSVIAASTVGGVPLKQTNATALPFTAAAEAKTLDKIDVPVVKNVPDVVVITPTVKK